MGRAWMRGTGQRRHGRGRDGSGGALAAKVTGSTLPSREAAQDYSRGNTIRDPKMPPDQPLWFSLYGGRHRNECDSLTPS